MKKIILSLTIFIASAIMINAQWALQTSGTTRNLWGVSFVDQNIGFVCGDSGTILKTINGGADWIPQNSGTKYQLAGLQFINANTGYCISWSDKGGKILKTINGGTLWNDISLNVSDANCGGFWFFNADTGLLAVGDNAISQSKILKTTNGGVTWDTVYTGGTGWISYFHFSDGNNGYATVGGMSKNGEQDGILKTTDGGKNWTLLTNIEPNVWMSGVYFFNKDTGFVGGGLYDPQGGIIYKTVDGGAHWTVSSNSYGTSIMMFTTPDIGYAIGFVGTNISVKSILKTTDAGLNWALDPTPSPHYLNGICFPLSDIGYAVGDTGTIIKLAHISGITEKLEDKKVTVYPNPADNNISLNFNIAYNVEAELRIYNVMGIMVRSEKVKQNSQKINIGDISSGIYMLIITSKDFIGSQKLIIQR